MNESNSPVVVDITSFSYKSELPPELFSLQDGGHGGGFVFDCRSLPNPGREERFKSRTGLQADVVDYLEKAPEVERFYGHVFELVRGAVANFIERGFSSLRVSFGCTGGQHRSVYMTERLASDLKRVFGDQVVAKVLHHSLTKKGLLS